MRSQALLAAALLCTLPFGLAMTCGSSEPTGSELFAAPQVDPIALSPDGAFLYVVNTPAAALEVFHVASGARSGFVPVGIGPSGLGVRPDGREVWVANHISDSVSVIDTDPASASYLQVVETIQSVDGSLVTLFDEPVDVAFASNAKAYVSLSSRNQIAVIDATTYTVSDFLPISAQEPRALRVANGKLYVTVLESGNQSELSGCPSQIFPPSAQCTFDLADVNFAQNAQFVGFDPDIVIDPDLPDRDLFVFDTASDAQVDVVSTVGTLLYGVAVDASDNVFIAMTDARNADNGRAGTAGQGLVDLDNRIFLNQIGRVDCSSLPCAAPAAIELEPLPPAQPAAGSQLATPYGVQVSGDGALLVGTAAASSRIFTYDTATNSVLGRLDVGAIPRGIALLSDGAGAAQTAFVLNALESTVSVVDVTSPAAPVATRTLTLSSDPTPDPIRRGRIAFNSAHASSTGTFSCASCHPDGHVDQLLWVIGAECTFQGCDQEEPRSTMPVKGLQDTLPLHWDGTLGDPFGGSNGEIGAAGNAAPNCTDEHDCFRHLVNASLSGVMCDQTGCPTNVNELSLAGLLGEAERDDMAEFLKSVSYGPPRSRRPDDVVTQQAVDGFEQFFTDVGGNIGVGPETCADAPGGCHALPHGTGTNAFFVSGMDAPTMRGITDRFLIFSAGVTLMEEQLVFSDPNFALYQPNISDVDWLPDTVGFDELMSWAQAFGTVQQPGAFRGVYNADTFDVFQMTEEAANGHSGALGRQLTLNTRTTNDAAALAEIQATLAVLEAADADGKIVLVGKGRRAGNGATYSFDAGAYMAGTLTQTRAELIAEAAAGTTLVTFTARLPANVTSAAPQPALAVPAVSERTGALGTLFDGRPDLPTTNPMQVDGLHIEANPTVLVNGQVAAGSVSCLGGSFSPTCDSSRIQVDLASPPTSSGVHLLQVQNPGGLASNELPFIVP